MHEPETSLLTAGASTAQILQRMTEALSRGGLETPAVDARLLVTAALAISKVELIVSPQRPITAQEAQTLEQFLARRLAHEPVSRILGEREFYGRVFTVTPDTLDPRPDSETLIEAALDILRDRNLYKAPLRIADIGTGTGCLLLTLLAELPQSTGIGTDVSQAALDVAAGNAARLGLTGRARWQLLRSLDGLEEPFDLLISNPPYIASGSLADLGPDVRLYDPRVALEGGDDGLDVYREIAGGLARHAQFQAAIFEVGAGQAQQLEGVLRDRLGTRVQQIRTWLDLGGHTRCVAVETH